MSLPLTFTVNGLDDIGGNYTEYNYENYTDDYICDPEEMGLQTFNAVFQPVLFSLIFLLGVVGNGLMVTVLMRRRRLLRITEIYLLHLAWADLMLLSTFPFDIVSNVYGWLFGLFLCKIVGLVKSLNILCGSFLLACIGFDRYLAIVHAIPSMQNRRPRAVHLTCISLWLVCFALSLPNVVFLSVKSPIDEAPQYCYHDNYGIHSNNWVLTIRFLDHACFFIPLAIMSYCYTAVVVTLCKTHQSHAKKGAIRLALLVTFVFCFCWLPYNITLLIKTMSDLDVFTHESCGSVVMLKPALDVTQSLGFSHCCLNPFLYAFIGVRFRKELIQLLYKLGCGRVCAPFIRAPFNRPSVSDGATTTSCDYH